MQLISTALVILGLYYVNKDELNYLEIKGSFNIRYKILINKMH